MKIYEVGGCVRDSMMGKEPKDIDYVVVDGTKEEMLELGYEQVGADFPVFLHPETKDEHALARVERKVGEGYKGFETLTEVNGKSVTLEEDLKRRDLTINAIAYDRENDEYIDPYGGMDDIQSKILRPVSKHFIEDPLRFLRVARFSARYPDFKVDIKKFKKLINANENILKELKDISSERVFLELEKVLGEDKPSNFFRTLKDLDILDIHFSYISDMIGKEQGPRHHAEGDVFEHTMRVFDESCKLTKNKVTRFGALVHDLGKPVTYQKRKDEDVEDFKKVKYYGHDNVDEVEHIFEYFKDNSYPKEYINFAKKAIKYHHIFHRVEDLSPKKLTKLFDKEKMFNTREEIQEMIYVAQSDANGRIDSDNDILFLNKKEIDEVFENGRIVKDGIEFNYAKLMEHSNYSKFLDLFDLTKTVNAKGIVNDEKYMTDGKSDYKKIQAYLYSEKLSLIKDYIKRGKIDNEVDLCLYELDIKL